MSPASLQLGQLSSKAEYRTAGIRLRSIELPTVRDGGSIRGCNRASGGAFEAQMVDHASLERARIITGICQADVWGRFFGAPAPGAVGPLVSSSPLDCIVPNPDRRRQSGSRRR